MPPFLDVLLYYLVGAIIPCNALYGLIMHLKNANYSDVPVSLVKKCLRAESILLIQAFLATLLIAHKYLQINVVLAIESFIIGWYEMKWLLSWMDRRIKRYG